MAADLQRSASAEPRTASETWLRGRPGNLTNSTWRRAHAGIFRRRELPRHHQLLDDAHGMAGGTRAAGYLHVGGFSAIRRRWKFMPCGVPAELPQLVLYGWYWCYAHRDASAASAAQREVLAGHLSVQSGPIPRKPQAWLNGNRSITRQPHHKKAPLLTPLLLMFMFA
jgi:hypothetical protein